MAVYILRCHTLLLAITYVRKLCLHLQGTPQTPKYRGVSKGKDGIFKTKIDNMSVGSWTSEEGAAEAIDQCRIKKG